MMTITFEIANGKEALELLTLYETIKEERKWSNDGPQVPSELEERMRSITLDDLVRTGKLDVRSANCLRADGLTDAYSIGKMFAKDSGRTMLKIPNLGKKSVKCIEICLHEIGFLV